MDVERLVEGVADEAAGRGSSELLAAGVGIGLFVLAGRVAKQIGSRLVFRAGLALRMAGFGVLGVLTLIPVPGAVALVMLAWPVSASPGHWACGQADADRRWRGNADGTVELRTRTILRWNNGPVGRPHRQNGLAQWGTKAPGSRFVVLNVAEIV